MNTSKHVVVSLLLAVLGTTTLIQLRPTTADDRPSRAYLHSYYLPASGIALDGFSPVSYFTVGQAERGSTDYAVDHDGVTYLLTSERQVEMFRSDPERYLPAYGGWCAFGMSIEDKFPVDPRTFKIENGRLLLFLNNEGVNARDLWNGGDAEELTRKADAHWQTVSG